MKKLYFYITFVVWISEVYTLFLDFQICCVVSVVFVYEYDPCTYSISQNTEGLRIRF